VTPKRSPPCHAHIAHRHKDGPEVAQVKGVELLCKLLRLSGYYSAEGGIFKRHWFEIESDVPAGAQYVRGRDLAASLSESAAFILQASCSP